ncbi:TIGR02996 domain-containing protein [Fimbriiglobus ruber]|uniref:Uncharacterized protein n=1 Tax=Fimbriiglobus ruber TaxID=1908690 RepID=A0A225EE96_9BACT|nr:TIGR02996 domain-containing protein [Fimbriiglobus ruber]OWK46705.1 hypothetical protein FRUB_00404 [Fimbriiglobus ruber]
MTVAADFIVAIIDRPDDDLPRLVFADYLEEAGDIARAEFIRVQCELARLPVDHPDRGVVADRERELLAAHKNEWKVPGLRGKQEFRRGFVEVIKTTADWLLAAASQAFATTPVRELRVYNAGHDQIEALARLPGLERIEALDLSNGLGYGGALVAFFATARLTALRRLVMRNNILWPNVLEQLAAAPATRGLESLDLSGNPIGDAGAAVLAGAPAFAGLTELIVRSDELDFADCIHATGTEALARSRTLTRLRKLDLRGHYVGDAGLINLATSEFAQPLVELDLSNNDIGVLGERGFEELVGSAELLNLRQIALGGTRNQVSVLAARELAGWDRLGQLERVDLRGAQFGSGATEIVRESRWADRFVLD